MSLLFFLFCFFFFNDTATTEIYTLSLHDALPIRRCSRRTGSSLAASSRTSRSVPCLTSLRSEEHTSNSSHTVISYAVFCLKKKKNKTQLLVLLEHLLLSGITLPFKSRW